MMRVSVGLAAAILACAATASAQDSKTEWVRKPSREALRAAWPTRAMNNGTEGFARLACEVNAQGGLESCRVLEETPAGEGFGAAALLMVPSFEMKPKRVDGKPVRSRVRVPIAFKNPSGASGWAKESAVMIAGPLWRKAPSHADLAAAWPARAVGVEAAHVSLRCRVSDSLSLDDCETLTETPAGQGFGAAARKLASGFELALNPHPEAGGKNVYVNLPVRFAATDAARVVAHPRWIQGLDPKATAAVFPAAAGEKGLVKGLGVADCAVGVGGGLVDCRPSRAEPADLGFAEAAATVAGVMRMSPWTDDGRPVDGARIKLPIRFEKAPAAAPT